MSENPLSGIDQALSALRRASDLCGEMQEMNDRAIKRSRLQGIIIGLSACAALAFVTSYF